MWRRGGPSIGGSVRLWSDLSVVSTVRRMEEGEGKGVGGLVRLGVGCCPTACFVCGWVDGRWCVSVKDEFENKTASEYSAQCNVDKTCNMTCAGGGQQRNADKWIENGKNNVEAEECVGPNFWP